MRLGGACHPEWGYLASAPNFLRTARIFIIAAAIGAMASAAVFCSLIYRPAAETSVAERTLVHAVDPTAVAGRTADAVLPQPQSEHYLVLEPRRAADAGAMPLQRDAKHRSRAIELPTLPPGSAALYQRTTRLQLPRPPKARK